MKNVSIILLAIGSFFIYSCLEIRPTAEFSLSYPANGSSYEPGETVTFINSSTNATTCRWRLPNGTVQTTTGTAGISYTIPTNDSGGTRAIELEAISAKGNKRAYLVQTFAVAKVQSLGNAYFWYYGTTGSTAGYNVYISKYGTSYPPGYLYYKTSFDPGCNSSTYYNVYYGNIVTGTYSYSASNGFTTFSGNFTVTNGGCTSVKLQ